MELSFVTDALAVKLTVLVTVLLWIKFLMTTTMLGAVRFRSGGRPPEDMTLIPGRQTVQHDFGTGLATDEAHRALQQQTTRWLRIVTNDLENLPLGLIVAWASLLVLGQSVIAALIHNIAVCAFLVGRIGHTVCYAKSIQPGRTIFWMIATVAVLTLGVTACIQVLSH